MVPKKFACEEHFVFTKDGYRLHLFRVHNKQNVQNKKPVFLQHGIVDSSDSFAFTEKDDPITTFLADYGYDVWLGNQRGNKYSHTHKNPDITRKEFFSYTMDEMAKYDIPTVLDYVYKKSEKKIIYIGHSLGNSQMFASLSDKKTTKFVHDRLQLFIAVAPVVYLHKIHSLTTQILSHFASNFVFFSKLIGYYEIFPSRCAKHTETKIESFICQLLGKDCINLLPGFMLTKLDYMPDMKNFLMHYPSGSSAKLMQYFSQIMNSDKPRFQKFDYKRKKNWKVYGQPIPPQYDLRIIKAKMNFIHFAEDKLSTREDAKSILKLVPKNNKVKEYTIPGWEHMSIFWAKDRSPLFKILKEILDQNK